VSAELAQALDEAARELLRRGDEESIESTLGLIVRAAIHTIPHVEQAGVSLVERGEHIKSYSPSCDAVRELDELQTEHGEGPCVDSIWQQRRTLVEDMGEAHDRWPRFAAAAQERGFGSLMAFQLFAGSGSAGALNLYASKPNVLDEATADIGQLFAAQAALVLQGARRVQGLHIALNNRDVIGQAKGILMERFAVDQERAFAMLVESSQHTNMKLVDVAHWLTAQAEQGGAAGRTGV